MCVRCCRWSWAKPDGRLVQPSFAKDPAADQVPRGAAHFPPVSPTSAVRCWLLFCGSVASARLFISKSVKSFVSSFLLSVWKGKGSVRVPVHLPHVKPRYPCPPHPHPRSGAPSHTQSDGLCGKSLRLPARGSSCFCPPADEALCLRRK